MRNVFPAESNDVLASRAAFDIYSSFSGRKREFTLQI